MKTRISRLLSVLLILCLAPGCVALAEEDIEAAPVDHAVEEVALDLSGIGFEVWSEADGIAPAEDETAQEQASAEAAEAPDSIETPEDTATPGGSASPEASIGPEATLAPELTAIPDPTRTPVPTEFPMQTALPKPDKNAHLGPVYLREPLKVNTLRLSRNNTSKSVTLGLPYVVAVKGETIKSVASKDEAVARADATGALTLYKAGETTIVIKTAGRKTFRLKLTVKDVPTPTGLAIASSKRHLVLSWDKVKHATGYMVQVSGNGKKWKDFKPANADVLKMDVAKGVTGSAWLRVVAILGDHFGGASEPVRVFPPVADVKVIQDESYYYGPTDKLNITWKPSVGAYRYEVWRASLPSDDYKLIGTTGETWFPDTLNPTALYSYKVRPAWNGLDTLPFSKPVNLWTGLEQNQLPPGEMDSSTGILLVVNKKAQVVTAYIRDANGNYALPLRHMICSTGRQYDRTRNGTYAISGHKGEWYTYPGPSGDTIRWPSVYRSGYYFHSPLYNRDHSIRGYTVNRLGSRASAGCVRLKSRDAEWVYKNCPNGTTVWICDGGARDDLKAAIKPKTVDVQGF